MRRSLAVLLGLVVGGAAHAGGPYPTVTGIAAAADDASVASKNPAGMTRFDSRAKRFDLLGFFSDSTWEGHLGDGGPRLRSEDSGTMIVPSGNLVQPFKRLPLCAPVVKEKRIYTVEESDALIAAADDLWAAIVMLAVTTGLRKSEILHLRWSDIDETALIITPSTPTSFV